MAWKPEKGEPARKHESGESPKLPEITPELLSETLTSPKFLKQLQKTSEITQKREFEAGFAVAANLASGEVIFGKVVNSIKTLPKAAESKWRGGIGDIDKTSLGKNFLSRGILPLLEVHTHPSGFQGPSEEDLIHFFAQRGEYFERGINTFPVMGILASPSGYKGEKLNLLLIQESRTPIARSKHAAEGAYNLILQIFKGRYDQEGEDPEMVLAALNQVKHVKTALMNFRQHGIGGEITPVQSKEEIQSGIAKFAFQPQRTTSPT